MQLEPEPFTKLLWFVRQPLMNSLALFELRDRFHTTACSGSSRAPSVRCWRAAISTARATRSQKLRWLFCLLFLPFVAHAVSLAASSQAIGYRTVFGLSGLVLVLVVFALRSVFATRRLQPALVTAAFSSLFVFAALSARAQRVRADRRAAGREWELIADGGEEAAARRATPTSTSFGPASKTGRPSKSSTTSSGRSRRMRTGRREKCSRPRCGSGSRAVCRRVRRCRSSPARRRLPRRARTTRSSTCASCAKRATVCFRRLQGKRLPLRDADDLGLHVALEPERRVLRVRGPTPSRRRTARTRTWRGADSPRPCRLRAARRSRRRACTSLVHTEPLEPIARVVRAAERVVDVENFSTGTIGPNCSSCTSRLSSAMSVDDRRRQEVAWALRNIAARQERAPRCFVSSMMPTTLSYCIWFWIGPSSVAGSRPLPTLAFLASSTSASQSAS